jgi:hypothetical protein
MNHLKKILKILLIQGILVQTISANVVAVLEIITSSSDIDLTIDECRHLTDELRAQARESLPKKDYTVLTRDNILQLLPPDEAERECLAESCAVTIGRTIGAEYATQGSIRIFQGMLTLTVELYETMSGNMLGSFVTESENARGLLNTIREKAPNLFANIKSEPRFSGLKDLPDTDTIKIIAVSEPVAPEPLAPSLPSPQPKKIIPPVYTIAAFALAAAGGGLAAWQHWKANAEKKNYDKSPSPDEALNYEDYRSRTEERNQIVKKVNNAENLRTYFTIGTGVLAIGGAITIFF